MANVDGIKECSSISTQLKVIGEQIANKNINKDQGCDLNSQVLNTPSLVAKVEAIVGEDVGEAGDGVHVEDLVEVEPGVGHCGGGRLRFLLFRFRLLLSVCVCQVWSGLWRKSTRNVGQCPTTARIKQVPL